MEWVAIAVNIARDPSVHRMAATLRIRVPEVVGLLALAFAEMSQHAPDGRVGDTTDALLESWAGWYGKRSRFAECFRAELCDAEGLVTAWEKYNGASIRRSKAARDRTRMWRETKQNANGMHTSTHTETVSVCGTEQDKTGPDRTEEQSIATPVAEPAAEPNAAHDIAEHALRVAMGPLMPAVDEFLALRPGEHRGNWYPALLKTIGPLTGTLPEDLAGACEDALLVVPPAETPVALRAFVTRRKVERVRASLPAPAIRVVSTPAATHATEDEALWSELQAVVSRLRRRDITTEEFNALRYPLRAGLRSVGGWQAVNETKPGSIHFVRRDFLVAYREATQQVSA